MLKGPASNLARSKASPSSKWPTAAAGEKHQATDTVQATRSWSFSFRHPFLRTALTKQPETFSNYRITTALWSTGRASPRCCMRSLSTRWWSQNIPTMRTRCSEGTLQRSRPLLPQPQHLRIRCRVRAMHLAISHWPTPHPTPRQLLRGMVLPMAARWSPASRATICRRVQTSAWTLAVPAKRSKSSPRKSCANISYCFRQRAKTMPLLPG